MWRCVVFSVLLAMRSMAGLADVPHPRLWMTDADQAAVSKRIESDPLMGRMHAVVMAEADKVLSARTTRYEIPDGRRLLRESRLAMHNIGHCAWAWRFTGKEAYLLRAVREMEAACAMQDWNPSHFLDTAEMSLAVAWGYDWLYHGLDGKQREYFAKSLIRMGLEPARNSYRGKAWWSKPKNNWSQVCGSGIALAAVCVAERDPELADVLFQNGVGLIDQCHRFYEPDGLYPEGPGYWHYGTNYHVKLISAYPALGMESQPSEILNRSGRSMMQLEGPSGLSFNFADAHARTGMPSLAQCWIANHFADPAQVAYVRNKFEQGLVEAEGGKAAPSPLELLWLPAQKDCEEGLPRVAFFGGEQPLATFRNSWAGDAVWMAIKGGTAAASHGHMDVGSFVYEAHGLRWIHDLGSDSYSLPSYFGNKRWDYYRLQNRSHNTLEIGGKLQNPEALPAPVQCRERAENALAVEVEMSDAYEGSADKAVRCVRFDPQSGHVAMVDVVERPVGDVVWRIVTDAAVRIEDDKVFLRKGAAEIFLLNVTGVGQWSASSALPATAAENQNDGFRQVILTIPQADAVEVKVEIVP